MSIGGGGQAKIDYIIILKSECIKKQELGEEGRETKSDFRSILNKNLIRNDHWGRRGHVRPALTQRPPRGHAETTQKPRRGEAEGNNNLKKVGPRGGCRLYIYIYIYIYKILSKHDLFIILKLYL